MAGDHTHQDFLLKEASPPKATLVSGPSAILQNLPRLDCYENPLQLHGIGHAPSGVGVGHGDGTLASPSAKATFSPGHSPSPSDSEVIIVMLQGE